MVGDVDSTVDDVVGAEVVDDSGVVVESDTDVSGLTSSGTVDDGTDEVGATDVSDDGTSLLGTDELEPSSTSIRTMVGSETNTAGSHVSGNPGVTTGAGSAPTDVSTYTGTPRPKTTNSEGHFTHLFG